MELLVCTANPAIASVLAVFVFRFGGNIASGVYRLSVSMGKPSACLLYNDLKKFKLLRC